MADPLQRGRDRAPFYLAQEGLAHHADEHRGRRLMIPQPEGDGSDILAWLEKIRV